MPPTTIGRAQHAVFPSDAQVWPETAHMNVGPTHDPLLSQKSSKSLYPGLEPVTVLQNVPADLCVQTPLPSHERPVSHRPPQALWQQVPPTHVAPATHWLVPPGQAWPSGDLVQVWPTGSQ